MMSESRGLIVALAERIALVDYAKQTEAKRYLDQLTKPVGSLGRLEEIAARMYAVSDGRFAVEMPKAVYVFAADHGVVAEGVSAYPAEVTRQMVLNFLAGGAAINALARANGVSIRVIDVGVDGDLTDEANVVHAKVRKGSRNMLYEPAMSEDELLAALRVGIRAADEAFEQGIRMLAVGEMGIGNTTAASAITAMLTGAESSTVTGRGTGVSEQQYRRKQAVIAAVVAHHQAAVGNPLRILQSVGGLEIVAMTGMMLAAASHRITVVMDGYISTAAAALACALVPAMQGYLFAGHRSQEPGHRSLLDYLGLEPILDLQMRLGEGTGAVLAMPIIEAAVRVYHEMATFNSAGVSGALAEAQL